MAHDNPSGGRPHEHRDGAGAPDLASGNSAEHTPDDIRWMDGRDASRNWAITRAQPVASLVVSGALWGFTRSVPPPPQLIGKRLIITAGGGHHPFKEAGDDGRAAVLEYCGVEVSIAEIPAGRERMFRDAVKTLPVFQSLGAVRLAAAYQIAHVIDGVVYADLRQGTALVAARQMGIWKEFDGRPLPRLETLERGRWLWCFDAAHEFDLDMRLPLKGFGGIWDYEKGLKLRGAI
ncbi:MAG: hypothetical protein Q8S09_12400 [Hyphomonas sp.]|nr:hypothetical protein [Hyphomonas sp.]